MRYEALKAKIQQGISGVEGTEESIVSIATENQEERNKLIKTFQEIKSYPNNYNSPNKGSGNRVFSQVEVEEFIKDKSNYVQFYGDGNYSKLTGDSDLVAFIKDTKISATIENLGDIYEKAENILKEENKKRDDSLEFNTNADMVYPTIEFKNEKTIHGSGAIEIARNWIESEKESTDNTLVGYYMDIYYKIDKWTDYISSSCTCHLVPDNDEDGGYHIDDHCVPTVGKKIQKKHYKVKHLQTFYNYKSMTGEIPGKDDLKENLVHIGKPCLCGGCSSVYGKTWEANSNEVDHVIVSTFRIKESYNQGTENNIRLACFREDTSEEPYYSKTPGYNGICDVYLNLSSTGWGWYEYNGDIQNIYEQLDKILLQINKDEHPEVKEKNNLTKANLGVKYRPTIDLGLYLDVKSAYLNINNHEVTYQYDKREQNGGTFKFGVNEYDLKRCKR